MVQSLGLGAQGVGLCRPWAAEGSSAGGAPRVCRRVHGQQCRVRGAVEGAQSLGLGAQGVGMGRRVQGQQWGSRCAVGANLVALVGGRGVNSESGKGSQTLFMCPHLALRCSKAAGANRVALSGFIVYSSGFRA